MFIIRALAAAALAAPIATATLAAVAAAPAAAADEAPAKVYSCAAEGQAVPEPTEVSLELNQLPPSVAPGDMVPVSGTLRLTLPDTTTLASRLQLATKLTLAGTNFAIEVTVDGKTKRVVSDAAFGEAVPIASPTVLQAAVTFPPVEIPDKADGRVVLTMPREATSKPQVTGAPNPVVFGVELGQDSPLMPTRALDCWLEDNDDNTVRLAVLPVAKSATPSTPPTAMPVDPSTSMPLPSAPLDGGESTSSMPLTAPAAESPASALGVESTATPPTANVQTVSAIPPRTVGKGTFVPYWSLAVIGLVFPVASVLLARHQRRRLLNLTNSRAA